MLGSSQLGDGGAPSICVMASESRIDRPCGFLLFAPDRSSFRRSRAEVGHSYRQPEPEVWGAWCFSDWGSFSSRESIG